MNVTINEAYIPYSEKCRLNGIDVHEGLNAMDQSELDRCCGMINGEVAYSQYNRVLLQLQLSTVVQPSQVYMLVQYQIHLLV